MRNGVKKVADRSFSYQSQVSILGPVGYGPTTLPLRHSDVVTYKEALLYDQFLLKSGDKKLSRVVESRTMASLISFQPPATARPINSSSSSSRLNPSPCKRTSQSVVSSRINRRLGWCRRSSGLGPSCGSRTTCWFKFGKNGVDAEGAGIYGSQARDDFDRDDVEQYFNYMGMLAVEGTYDKMEALLSQNIHPVDILLMMAASEGDKPKIEELLRAGADFSVKDADGRTAIDRAVSDEIREFILGFSVQKA